MEFYKTKTLCDALPGLVRRGGPYQRAAESVHKLLGRIHAGETDPLKGFQTTNHGESRIEHCVKYDLAGRCRLITVQHEGRCLLLNVAEHNDADKWLKANEGKKFALNDKCEIVEIAHPSHQLDSSNPFIEKKQIRADFLYEKLSTSIYDRLVDDVSRSVCRVLETITYADEKRLFEIVQSIGDKELESVLLDVFILLINGDDIGAEHRAQLYLGDVTDLTDVDVETTIVDGEFLKRISPDAPEYPNFLRRFAETANYKEWMLFMHPRQEAIAFNDFNGPAKLLGVSGSGKTCIVVQRSIFLAKKYPDEQVLVVTLNRPLAQLIDELVSQLAEPQQRKCIKVQPFFSVCQELLHRFEPENTKLYEDVTWKSDEHIDDIWREYYRCALRVEDASVMQSVHDSLISRGINAEEYIREEFDWIRSAYPQSHRNKYLDMDRSGRTIPLQASQRALLLQGLEGWEEKMKHVGVTDYLNISTALYRHENKIQPEYRCVLIDESQDFGNIEFSIARRLVGQAENDLFLCGDAAQKVSTKYQRLKDAGIDLPGARSKKLTKNYRNSKEILEAANFILETNMTEEMLISGDFEILDPEYASFSGAVPVLMEGASLEDEIASALSYVRQELRNGQNACIAIAGFSLREIELFSRKIGVPVLNGRSDLSKAPVFIADLEQTKGFEFDYVCIVNCSDGIIPNPHVPTEEHFRELSRLYVAMTRAKLELILSFSETPSSMFNDTDDYFCDGSWASYVEGGTAEFDKPDKLPQTVHEEDIPDDPLEMTGKQFLYRPEAIGMSTELVHFIREKVDGRGLVSANVHSRVKRRVKWRSMGQLLDDLITLDVVQHKVSKDLVHELCEVFGY